MAEKSFRFHPQNVLLTLVLMGISMLFLALCVAYIYSRVQHHLPPVRLPLLFFINTLVLGASSWTLICSERAYDEDQSTRYQRHLVITLVLSLLFLSLQILAWVQLFRQAVFVQSSVSSSFLYALSFLHFLHVVGGMPFMIWFVLQASKKLKYPVSALLYFSDDDHRRGLKLLAKYWHFLDILWILLVLFLGVNMFF